VSRFLASRKNLGASAEALTAFFHGGSDEDAEVGALVVADAIDCLRVVREALTSRRRGG
jgi:hypothetical protein